MRHGALAKCRVEGCTNVRRNRGVCGRHGAVAKKCIHEGCTNDWEEFVYGTARWPNAVATRGGRRKSNREVYVGGTA